MGAGWDARARGGETLAAAPVLALFQSDMIRCILELAGGAPNALFVTKLVARAGRPAALAVRRLFWKDRIAKGNAILEGHTNRVTSCAFSPDGERVVMASDYKAWLWDAATGALQVPTTTLWSRWCFGALCGPAAGAPQSGQTTIWLLRRGPIRAISPDGKRVATAKWAGEVQLWDAATGALQNTLKGEIGYVFSCAFSPDGTRIATASLDNTAQLWDATTGALQITLEEHAMSCAFSPDGKRLVTAGYTARLWDAGTGALQMTLEGHTGCINRCAFSPDGKRVVTAGTDKTGRIWDAATGALQATLEGHTKEVLSCAFSPDGKRVVTTSEDGTARLWDAAL